MDYFTFIQSTVTYIENRLKTELNQTDLEIVTGFSLSHARDIFKTCTKISLAKYVLYRKVSNAAFELIHTNQSILAIATDYGFESYDTFTRAFKRITGVTPSEFRKQGFLVGRVKLSAGTYGPGIIKENRIILNQQPELEDLIRMKTVKTQDSCILLGVPKVQYCPEECTPFPSTLKAVLNYMGQDISYAYLMAASGASFRLRWNTTCWDGGNVGITFIYEDQNEAYRRSFQAAGRSYQIIERKQSTPKNEFINLIKQEIDGGRPIIAIGIIGPPEACIITGYRNNGETLLGWSFFQENPEFARDVEVDESGYFISSKWWENHNTVAVMAVGEELQEKADRKELLTNAVNILTKDKIGDYAGGQAAFDVWASALSDESQFPKEAILPILFERLMCQGDAMDMIGEGRNNAATFLEWVAKHEEEISEKCLKASRIFKEEAAITGKMCELLGGWQREEEQAMKLADSQVRKGLVKLIKEAKNKELLARKYLEEIVYQIL